MAILRIVCFCSTTPPLETILILVFSPGKLRLGGLGAASSGLRDTDLTYFDLDLNIFAHVSSTSINSNIEHGAPLSLITDGRTDIETCFMRSSL